MQTILFDLDGTLINHFTTITRSINYAEQTLGLPISSQELVISKVGGGIALTLERLLGKEQASAAYPLFHQYFDDNLFDGVIALPGALQLLEQLKAQGKTLAVFTNKGGDHSRALTKHLGMDPYLDANVGTRDTAFRKPQPEFTHYILDRLLTTADQTIMIGDSPFDFEAAQAGGMPCYLVATGSHSLEQLREETNAAGYYENLPALAKDLFGLEIS